MGILREKKTTEEKKSWQDKNSFASLAYVLDASKQNVPVLPCLLALEPLSLHAFACCNNVFFVRKLGHPKLRLHLFTTHHFVNVGSGNIF